MKASHRLGSSSVRHLAEAFESVARGRFTNRLYDRTRKVPSPVIRRILELGQLAPTSFNLQPFQYLIIRSPEAKDLLASSMIGNNARVVSDTSFSIAFLAENGKRRHYRCSYRTLFSMRMEIDPARNAKSLMELEREAGTDPNYIASLPAKLNFLLGKGRIARGLKKITSHLLSPLRPMPVIDIDNRAWAAKNVGFVAQQVMLACTSYGLASTPMEGFDERRLCYQLEVPLDQFSVPLVLSVGYPQGTTDESMLHEPVELSSGDDFPKKARFPLEARCFENKYGNRISF